MQPSSEHRFTSDVSVPCGRRNGAMRFAWLLWAVLGFFVLESTAACWSDASLPPGTSYAFREMRINAYQTVPERLEVRNCTGAVVIENVTFTDPGMLHIDGQALAEHAVAAGESAVSVTLRNCTFNNSAQLFITANVSRSAVAQLAAMPVRIEVAACSFNAAPLTLGDVSLSGPSSMLRLTLNDHDSHPSAVAWKDLARDTMESASRGLSQYPNRYQVAIFGYVHLSRGAALEISSNRLRLNMSGSGFQASACGLRLSSLHLDGGATFMFSANDVAVLRTDRYRLVHSLDWALDAVGGRNMAAWLPEFALSLVNGSRLAVDGNHIAADIPTHTSATSMSFMCQTPTINVASHSSLSIVRNTVRMAGNAVMLLVRFGPEGQLSAPGVMVSFSSTIELSGNNFTAVGSSRARAIALNFDYANVHVHGSSSIALNRNSVMSTTVGASPYGANPNIELRFSTVTGTLNSTSALSISGNYIRLSEAYKKDQVIVLHHTDRSPSFTIAGGSVVLVSDNYVSTTASAGFFQLRGPFVLHPTTSLYVSNNTVRGDRAEWESETYWNMNVDVHGLASVFFANNSGLHLFRGYGTFVLRPGALVVFEGNVADKRALKGKCQFVAFEREFVAVGTPSNETFTRASVELGQPMMVFRNNTGYCGGASSASTELLMFGSPLANGRESQGSLFVVAAGNAVLTNITAVSVFRRRNSATALEPYTGFATCNVAGGTEALTPSQLGLRFIETVTPCNDTSGTAQQRCVDQRHCFAPLTASVVGKPSGECRCACRSMADVYDAPHAGRMAQVTTLDAQCRVSARAGLDWTSAPPSFATQSPSWSASQSPSAAQTVASAATATRTPRLQPTQTPRSLQRGSKTKKLGAPTSEPAGPTPSISEAAQPPTWTITPIQDAVRAELRSRTATASMDPAPRSRAAPAASKRPSDTSTAVGQVVVAPAVVAATAVAFASVDPSAAADAQAIGLLSMSGCETSTEADGASSSASRTVLPLDLGGITGEDYGGLAGQAAVVGAAFLLNAVAAAARGSERGRFPSVAVMVAGLAAKGFGVLAGRESLASGAGAVAACCAVGCVALFVACEQHASRAGRVFVSYDPSSVQSIVPNVLGPVAFASGRWEPAALRKRFSSTFGGYRPHRTWLGAALVVRSAALGALIGVRGSPGDAWCSLQPYIVAATLLASGLTFALATPKRQPLLNASGAVASLLLAGAWGTTAAIPNSIAPLLFVTAASLGSMVSSAGALVLGFIDRRVARAHAKSVTDRFTNQTGQEPDSSAAPLLTMPAAASTKPSLGASDGSPSANDQPTVAIKSNPLQS